MTRNKEQICAHWSYLPSDEYVISYDYVSSTVLGDYIDKQNDNFCVGKQTFGDEINSLFEEKKLKNQKIPEIPQEANYTHKIDLGVLMQHFCHDILKLILKVIKTFHIRG